jgi:hypothetical protein
MMLAPLLLLMVGNLAQTPAIPKGVKAVFLSHAPLTDEQLVVLEKPTEAEIRTAAKERKLVVEKIGDAITIRDENFFDIDRFDTQLRAIQFLTEQVRQGKKGFKMKELDPEVRKQVVSLFIQGMLDYNMGQKLNDDETAFGLNADIVFEVEANGARSILSFSTYDEDGRRPTSEVNVTADELKEYVAQIRPKLRPKVDVNQVQYRFSQKWIVSSSERMELAANVSSTFAERLKGQKEAYEKIRSRIVDAFLPSGVSKGMRLSGLPPAVVDALRQNVTEKDRASFDKVLEHGTIADIFGHIRVYGSSSVDGKRRRFSVIPSNLFRGG